MKISSACFPLAATLIAAGLAMASPAFGQISTASATNSSTALVHANNAFAFDLYRQIAPAADQNAFFSPYSVSTALAMTWAGAHGDTAAQMARVLHFDNLPTDQVAPDFGALQKSLDDVGKKAGVQLALANSLWPEQNAEIPLRPEYIKSVEQGFNSAIFPVDYKNQAEAVRQHINTWVEDKTNQRIKNLLQRGQVTPDTRLILVNAIYFKGNWIKEFDAAETNPLPFTLANGKTVSTPVMHKSFEHSTASYTEITDGPLPMQILALPYVGNELEFVALLPKPPTSLADLEKTINADQLEQWMSRVHPFPTLEVYLPKFKLNARYELTPSLKTLGMMDAFDATRADFSGMTSPSYLSISMVAHQAFVEVNEEGTEAAAATGVVMYAAAAMAGPPPVFRADHPFLFLIRDRESGSILFMGRLASPDSAK